MAQCFKTCVSQQTKAVTPVRASTATKCRPVAFSSVSRSACAARKASPLVKKADRSLVAARVASQQAPSSSSSTGTTEWYALVANAEFFFNDVQNESIAEQLRERVRYFKEQNRERDFYLVPNPAWLDEKYPEEGKKVKRPCVALVSTDKYWIVFMKLRLDRVLRIDMGPVPVSEVTKSTGKLPEFKKSEKWTAPYPRYADGWWEVFFP